MKKVLILTVTAGMGHNSTAKAIEDELSIKKISSKTVDVYKYINKIMSETLNKSTELYAKYTPDIYRVIYEFLDKGNTDDKFNILGLINNLCSLKIEKLIDDYRPDVIVCTHVFAAQIIDEIKRKGKTYAKLLGIITDYTLHPFWESIPTLDYCIIANEKLRYRAIKKGIPNEKIKALGIPINPKFYLEISKEDARKQLNLPQTSPVVLVMGGGLGLGVGVEEIEQILSLSTDVNILIVCGKSKKLAEKFRNLEDRLQSKRLFVYGFVDNVHIMMSAADIFVSKPGGLSVTEAFAKKLPMVMINPLAGQEERNAEFMINCGLALFANKTFTLDEAINMLITDPQIPKRLIENIDRIIIKRSSEEIGRFIEELIK